MKPVVLDACVLFQGRPTDLLLAVAAAGGFAPVWSPAIDREWRYALTHRRGIPEHVITMRSALLDQAFPGASVAADPMDVARLAPLLPRHGMSDAHVVATALAADATLIVTRNVRDFRGAGLRGLGVEGIDPDTFLARLFAERPEVVIAGVRAHRRRSGGVSPDAYLSGLRGYRVLMRRTAALLAAWTADI